jgi:hypothetical protein
MPMHQGRIDVLPPEKSKSDRWSSLVWPAVYEVHNLGTDQITINGITAKFEATEVTNPWTGAGVVRLELYQVPNTIGPFTWYRNYAELCDHPDVAVDDTLPFTLQPGEKRYIRIPQLMQVLADGQAVATRSEKTLYVLAYLAIGGPKNTPLRGRVKSFHTVVRCEDATDVEDAQSGILLLIGDAFKNEREHLKKVLKTRPDDD